MKKNFIIHIGPHKTGSTYIQKTLFDNKNRLKEFGTEYSEIVKKGHIAHHDLAEKLYTKQYKIANTMLRKIKNSNNNLLISSENFDRLDNEDIEFLAQAINQYKVKIVFFKRRLDDLLVSSWQESVKHGGVESWSKYMVKHLLKPFSSEVLNSSKIVDLYINTFGKDKVNIIDFDNAKESKKDICDLLFEAINIPKLKGIGSKEKINKSMSYAYIEIIRVLNILYIEHNKTSPHHFLRERFMACIKNNQDDVLIKKLVKSIEKDLESVNLNNTFIFNHLNKSFNDMHKELIINKKLDDHQVVENTYELPNETWYMKSEIMEQIELLYVQIENTRLTNGN